MTNRTLVGGLLALVMLSACECGKPPPTVEKLKKEGEACTSDDVCETGLCDAAPGFPTLCVRKCSVGCVAGEVCTQLTPNRFACQPDLKKLCQACEVDADCPYPADHCLVVNGEHVCGRDCAFDQACPSGYHCVNGKGVDDKTYLQQCTPEVASCACLARGDFLQPCEVTNSFGTCKGTKQCDLVANKVVCDARTPAAEACNGKDDNCNGSTDEGQSTASCGVGECARTMSTCADGGVAACVPGQPVTEACNGKDDDCDGKADNGFNLDSDVQRCGSCTTVCSLPHATPMCATGKCKVASCEQGYGDCNHQDSDGCETNTQTDALNCGGCGTACAQTNSTASCVAGKCAFTCTAGWVDLDKIPANGCEYQCTFKSTTDVPDLNLEDANCDGIDGELGNAIFVSVKGVDTAAGDRDHPVRTLTQAVSLLVLTGKRDLYLAGTGPGAADVYAGPLQLNLANNTNVAGGYDQVTWKRSLQTTTLVQGGNPALKIESSTNVLVQALRFEGGNGDATTPTAFGGYVKGSTGVKFESLNLIAGNGMDGTPGAAGAQGTAGDPGVAGGKGCVGQNWPIGCLINYSSSGCSAPSAGAGGASACGYPGGSGGAPTYANGATGGGGTAAPNGTGGAGTGAPNDKATGIRGLPYAGGTGQSGTSGGNGAPATTTGALTATGFVVSSGTGGTAGTAGKGGGGGGGGAGNVTNGLLYNPCDTYGSAGGGGGGGACGGAGGQGGQGGGASIGLFLTGASTVSGQGVVIKAGNGGKGGNGGAAGPGGLGGQGGASPYDSDQGFASVGGPGGNGGNGGNGGVGGGGAGGNVYGLARSSTSTWTQLANTSVTMGTPGAGGTSPAPLSAAPAGAANLATVF